MWKQVWSIALALLNIRKPALKRCSFAQFAGHLLYVASHRYYSEAARHSEAFTASNQGSKNQNHCLPGQQHVKNSPWYVWVLKTCNALQRGQKPGLIISWPSTVSQTSCRRRQNHPNEREGWPRAVVFRHSCPALGLCQWAGIGAGLWPCLPAARQERKRSACDFLQLFWCCSDPISGVLHHSFHLPLVPMETRLLVRLERKKIAQSKVLQGITGLIPPLVSSVLRGLHLQIGQLANG